MSRCLACNRQLNEIEILGTKPDGTPEDMCARCRAKAKESYRWTNDYNHQFEDITDPYKAHLRELHIHRSERYLNEPE